MSLVNKVEINTPNGKETILDLTGDSVTPETLAEGVTAHDASGERIVGTFTESDPTVPAWAKQENPPVKPAEEVVDSAAAHIKDVPANALPYAEVVEVGGITRKCTNLFDNSKVGSSITPTTTGFSFTGEGAGMTVALGRLKNLCPNVKVGDSITYHATRTNQYETKKLLYISSASKEWYAGKFITVTQEMLDSLVYVYGVSGETCTFDYMRVVYAADTPYEPYFEGLRSAKVESVKSVGRNLAIMTNGTYQLASFCQGTLKDGHIKLNFTNVGELSSTLLEPYSLIYLKKGKYTMSVNYTNDLSTVVYFRSFSPRENVVTINLSTGADSRTATFELYEDRIGCVCVYAYLNANVGTSGVFEADIMLNKGDEALPFEPVTRHTLPIPAEVQALPDYGDGYSAVTNNKICFEEGKRTYHRLVKRMVFDGTENWKLRVSASGKTNRNYVSLNVEKYGAVVNKAIICSHFDTYALAFTNTVLGIYVLNSNGYDAAMITVRPWSGITDVTEWKTYLAEQYAAGTPVTVVYGLAEAEVTDISDILPADNLIGVEGGGTVTMVNEYGYDVPNTVVFHEGANEIVGAKRLVGDLTGTAARALADGEGKPLATREWVLEQLAALMSGGE